MPALRERREDIPLLAIYFMDRMAAHLNKPIAHFTPQALETLAARPWPGNVRELEHTVNHAVITCPGPAIGPEHLSPEFSPRESHPDESPEAEPAALNDRLAQIERHYIVEALDATGWVVKGENGAAKRLGLKERTLSYRMAKLGIRRPG